MPLGGIFLGQIVKQRRRAQHVYALACVKLSERDRIRLEAIATAEAEAEAAENAEDDE